MASDQDSEVVTREIEIEVNELYDPVATFISIVPRGANRLPMKVLKEDKTMIDVSNLFKGLLTRKAETLPEVLGILVPSTLADGYVTTLKSDHDSVAALPVAGQPEVSFVSFSGADVDFTTCTVFKSGDEKGVVVQNVKKALVTWPYTSKFNEAIQANVFMPTLRTAMDTLYDVVWKIKEEVMTPDELNTALSQAIDDFKAFALSQVPTLPETVFKMDKLVSTAAAPAAEPVVTAAPVITKDPVEQEDTTTTVVKADGAGAAATAEPAKVVEAEKDSTAEMLQTLISKVEGLSQATASVSALQDSVNKLSVQVTELGKTTTEAVQKAELASSHVFGSTTVADTTAPVVSQKSDLGPLGSKTNVENY